MKEKKKKKKKNEWRPVVEAHLTCNSFEEFSSRTSNSFEISSQQRKGFSIRRIFYLYLYLSLERDDDALLCLTTTTS